MTINEQNKTQEIVKINDKIDKKPSIKWLKKKSKKGFTLIEMIVIVGIISVLAAIFISKTLDAQKKVNDELATATVVKLNEYAGGWIMCQPNKKTESKNLGGNLTEALSKLNTAPTTTIHYTAENLQNMGIDWDTATGLFKRV